MLPLLARSQPSADPYRRSGGARRSLSSSSRPHDLGSGGVRRQRSPRPTAFWSHPPGRACSPSSPNRSWRSLAERTGWDCRSGLSRLTSSLGIGHPFDAAQIRRSSRRRDRAGRGADEPAVLGDGERLRRMADACRHIASALADSLRRRRLVAITGFRARRARPGAEPSSGFRTRPAGVHRRRQSMARSTPSMARRSARGDCHRQAPTDDPRRRHLAGTDCPDAATLLGWVTAAITPAGCRSPSAGKHLAVPRRLRGTSPDPGSPAPGPFWAEPGRRQISPMRPSTGSHRWFDPAHGRPFMKRTV